MLEVTHLERSGNTWWVLVEDTARVHGWWGRNKDVYEARAAAFKIARRDRAAPDNWIIERDKDGKPRRLLWTGGKRGRQGEQGQGQP